ncbi:hypothetical protein [Xylella fastidiosa]|uniref:hypothetical protein n=1 Tax=Xylella fastidiosa TaxID=2371 RepID=UPI0037296906
MFRLSVLDADPLFAHQYISSLNLLVSDIECQIEVIQNNLLRIGSLASKASDEVVLGNAHIMYLYSTDIFSELQELNCRLSRLSSLYSISDI